MHNELETKTRLRKLKVYAVGLVDSPAIKRKFLIMKRNTPTVKVLSEAKYPLIQRPSGGAWNWCVCPECGYSKKHKAGEQCYKLKCPKCGKNLVGSNTRRLRKEGGETKMGSREKLKDAIVEAAEQVAAEFEGEDPEETTGTPEKKIEKEKDKDAKVSDKELEKKIGESAKDISAQKKSAYTDFMTTCMKAGKSLKECIVEWKKKETKTKKTEPEKKSEKEVEKAKVKVEVETEEKESLDASKKVASDKVAGAFVNVFSSLDRHIGEAKKDEDKRKWRAVKALLSKTISSLSVEKSETSVEDLDAGLDKVATEIDEVLKAYPKSGEKDSNIPAGTFKSVFSKLDSLIAASDEKTKSALQKVKSVLSKVVGGTYLAPTTKGKEVEISEVEELALLSEQISEFVGRLDKLEKGQNTIQDLLDKVPVPKGRVKKETPRKQTDDADSAIEKHKDKTAPQRARAVIKELVDNA